MPTNKKKVSVQARQKEIPKKSKKGLVIGLSAVGAVALVLIVVFAIVLPIMNRPNARPQIEIDIQDYGVITLELDRSQAPATVDNFTKLVREGFYDGITLHRIMDGFMMQGGDPQGTGAGGSSVKIKGEFSSNGVNNTISHKRGTISMARSGNDNNSASSQFFIVHQDSTFLDGDYAAFGHVLSGMEVVDAICQDSLQYVIDSNGTIPAEYQPIIKSIKILE